MIRILIREITRVPERARQRKEKAVARRGTSSEWVGRERDSRRPSGRTWSRLKSGKERGEGVRLYKSCEEVENWGEENRSGRSAPCGEVFWIQ